MSSSHQDENSINNGNINNEKTSSATLVPDTNAEKVEKLLLPSSGTESDRKTGTQSISSEGATSPTSSKRPSADLEDTLSKRHRSDTALSTAAAASSLSDKNTKVFDATYVYGLQAGDRVLVKWDIVKNEGTDEEEVVQHWWGATLLEYDGRTYSPSSHDDEDDDDQNNKNIKDNNGDDDEEDGENGSIAIHVLEYDAYPAGGSYEKVREDVIFVGEFELLDMKTQDMMQYKREGDDGMVTFDVDHIEEIVNNVLTAAMKKSIVGSNFEALPASIQLQVAEKIAQKKTKLVSLMEEFFTTSGKRIMTQRDIKQLIETTMQEN